MGKAVVAKNIYKYYGRFCALKGISFDVDEGEFFVIIGPSGCGKSTLLKVLAGLLKHDRGALYIGGEDVKDIPPHMRDISLMLETYALFPHMSVRDNIAFGLRMMGVERSEREKAVAESLKLVGMEGFEKRLPLELSAGQRQRVALVRSLVLKPHVLLLDDPLSSVDYVLQRRLMEELKDIHRKVGGTFILTTHYQEHGLSLADRMMVMNTGVVEQIDVPKEIYDQPRTVFAARFLGRINLFHGEIISKRGPKYLIKTEKDEFVGLHTDERDIVGTKLAYGIRPERIEIGEEAVKRDNRFKTKLTGHYYFGEVIEYVFETREGMSIKVRKPPKNEQSSLRIGQSTWIGWNAEDAVLLEKPSMIEGQNIEEVIYGK